MWAPVFRRVAPCAASIRWARKLSTCFLLIVYKASIFESIKGLLAHHIDAEEVVTCQAVLFMLARDYISSLDMKKQESRTSDDSIEPPLDAEDPRRSSLGENHPHASNARRGSYFLVETILRRLRPQRRRRRRNRASPEAIIPREEFSHSSAACESAVASAKKKTGSRGQRPRRRCLPLHRLPSPPPPSTPLGEAELDRVPFLAYRRHLQAEKYAKVGRKRDMDNGRSGA